MAGETDEANLASFLRFLEGFDGAAFEDAFGIFRANHFMHLHEIDGIGLQTFQAFFNG